MYVLEFPRWRGAPCARAASGHAAPGDEFAPSKKDAHLALPLRAQWINRGIARQQGDRRPGARPSPAGGPALAAQGSPAGAFPEGGFSFL
jgi:hypothetical protein